MFVHIVIEIAEAQSVESDQAKCNSELQRKQKNQSRDAVGVVLKQITGHSANAEERSFSLVSITIGDITKNNWNYFSRWIVLVGSNHWIVGLWFANQLTSAPALGWLRSNTEPTAAWRVHPAMLFDEFDCPNTTRRLRKFPEIFRLQPEANLKYPSMIRILRIFCYSSSVSHQLFAGQNHESAQIVSRKSWSKLQSRLE